MKEVFAYFANIHHIEARDYTEIEKIAHEFSIKKNELLQPIGQTCKTIYFLKSGIARIFYYKDGVDITESFAFENNIVARVESLFTGIPSKKGIQILEDAKIISINATSLFKLYDSHPNIERLFRLIFEKAYVDTINRIESIQFHSADERYNQLLQETDYLKIIPLKYIASYLGITQVSLSRIRAKSR
jgi:CRP-like cAMP-binding protein